MTYILEMIAILSLKILSPMDNKAVKKIASILKSVKYSLTSMTPIMLRASEKVEEGQRGRKIKRLC